MSQRNRIQSITHNLSTWCLSRNFDLNGYWAVGKIYSLTRFKRRKEVIFNLNIKTNPIKSPENLTENIGAILQTFMIQQINKSQMLHKWIDEIKLTFSFETGYIEKYHANNSRTTGKPFLITVEIKSDLGKTFTHSSGGYARKHSKILESRRAGF